MRCREEKVQISWINENPLKRENSFNLTKAGLNGPAFFIFRDSAFRASDL